jgi:S1-C subfamily serine protease
VREQPERPSEFGALGGQLVGGPGWPLRVGPGHQQSVALEPGTPGHVTRRLRRAVGLPDSDGLLIREVMQDSPAASAGLAQGDLIVAAAGQPVRTPDDLFDALRAAQGGGTIELSIVRGTDERAIQVAFDGNGQPDQDA